MPRVEMVRYSVTKAGSDRSESWYSEAGMTYREILTEEIGVNPNKFTLYVNGSPANMDDMVREGDSLDLQPQKYSSGG